MNDEETTMPSPNYENRKGFFDKVFSNGVDPFIHQTGVVGVRVVPQVEEQRLDPYYNSPYGQRSKSPGDFSIFLADTEETARAEVFQNAPFSGYPPNSWSLEYRYTGIILDINRIPDKQFKDQFLQSSGNDKHEFSRDLRYYLDEKGLTGKTFDSIGWTSVQGDKLGIGGFVYNWVSGVKPSFDYLRKTRLDVAT